MTACLKTGAIYDKNRSGDEMEFLISTDKNFDWQEQADLLRSVGWGDGYDEQSMRRSVDAYPLFAQARDKNGLLLGYLKAFSDGIFSTIIGEIVVRPTAQKAGIGKALLATVEQSFPGIPIHLNALGDAKYFFEHCGYKSSSQMTYMFKKL
jgi:GNAT superfamily N-acetyltransferase